MIVPNDRCIDTSRDGAPSGTLFEAQSSENVIAAVYAGRRDFELTIRLLEVGGSSGSALITYPPELLRRGPERAFFLSPTEAPQSPIEIVEGQLALDIAPNQIVTLGLGWPDRG